MSRDRKAFIFSFGAGVISRVGHVALAILLARAVGVSDYGVFVYAMGVGLLLGQLTTLGWGALSNRLIPQYKLKEKWGEIKGLVYTGDLIVLFLSLLIILILGYIAPFTGQLAYGLQLGSFLVPVLAFALLRRQQLAAVHKAPIGLLFDQGLSAIALSFFILFIGVFTVASAVYIFVLFSIFGIIVTTVILHQKLPTQSRQSTVHIEIRFWLALSLPMILGQSSRLLMNKIDILLLAPLAGMTEVGLYGAAFRVTYIMSFPQVILMTILTPMLSEAFAHGNIARLRHLMKMSFIYGAITTLPFVIVILAYSKEIMLLVFGVDFIDSSLILIVLAFSQLAASLAIPCASALMMGGREKIFGAVTLAALLTSGILCAILIPLYGALGAAIASAIASSLLFAVQFYLSRQLLISTSEG